ncbi:outer membrane beta-barrel protein, partial [Desulfobacterales bacterium HSG2]|nr:outer membrane beta-barrel protein [Desulfobacterales bacterium HSG2]
ICFLTLICLLLSAASSQAGYQVIFTPRFSVTPEYTDNLFSSNEDEEQEYITVISPGFTVQILEKTRGATLSYDLGYSCYDSSPEFNTLRHNSQLSGWIRFTRHTRLEFQNRFVLTEESVTKLEESETEDEVVKPEKQYVAEKETVRKTKEYYYTNDADIAFTHQFGESDVFNMKYAYGILENEDPTIEDRTTHNPAADVTYWIMPKQLSMTAGASYTRDEFSSTEEDPSYWEESVNPHMGLSYWFKPDEFGIETEISYTSGEYLSKSDMLKHWYESINPSLSLVYKYVPYHLELEGNLSHTIGRFSDPSDDFDNWNGSVSLSKKFTKKIEGFVRYAHAIMDFKGNNENYSIYDPSVGITYTVAEDTPLSLSVGYFVRDRQTSPDEAAMSVNGDIGKTWPVGRYGSISFKTSSGYDEDYFGAEKMGFGVYYEADFTAKYAFYKDIIGDVSGSYKKDKFKDLEITRDDETKEIGAGLSFQKKWGTIRFDYTYRTLDSTLSENDYEENRIRWQIMLSPSRPIRLFQ